MVDKMVSELATSGGPFVLIIDDLHELSSAEAAEQLTSPGAARGRPPSSLARCDLDLVASRFDHPGNFEIPARRAGQSRGRHR
jgi:hypothetical protein